MNYVYFIRPKGQMGPIKIGCSHHPEMRTYFFQTWSPFELEVVAVTPGSWCLERQIQAMFAEQHSHGEWFFPCRALLSLIDRLAAGEKIGDIIDVEPHSAHQNSVKRIKRRSAIPLLKAPSVWGIMEPEREAS
jgi:hypothetical protein